MDDCFSVSAFVMQCRLVEGDSSSRAEEFDIV